MTTSTSPAIASAPPTPGMKVWEAGELKAIVDEWVSTDPRFVGLSRYLYNVRIFWSFEIPTACAGHGFIFFNPDFYASIPEETRKTVMVHEVWHIILRHLERGKNCDPETHNTAADHVINNALQSDGFTFDGTDPCLDPQYAHMSTEQVYNTIWEKRQRDNTPPDPGSYIPASQIEDLIEDVLEADGAGVGLDDQKDKSDKNIEAFSKQAGSDPGHTGILLQNSNTKVIAIGVSYQEIFKDFLVDPLSGGKRTFMRPNRRQHGMKGSKLQLPGRFPKRGHLNRLTHLTYALDVSGSITQKQAQQFHDSVRTIKELLNPEFLTVLFFDTRIVHEQMFTDKEPYTKIKVNAGGGTDLTGVYKRTKELDSEALVIFTDLCVNIPKEPDWQTIWIVPEMTYVPPDCTYGDIYLIPPI